LGETSNVSVDRDSEFGCCGFVERAGEESENSLGRSRDHEVRAVGGSWLKLHPTSGRNDGHRGVSRLDLDRGVRSTRVDSIEDVRDERCQPGAAELIIAGRSIHERACPPGERVDGLFQALPPFRQRVRAAAIALDDAVLFEVAKPVGQQVGGYARKAFLEIAVTAGTSEELAHDEQGPPISHDVEAPSDRTVLAVGPHAPRLTLDNLKSSL
jgi:hypothetical protein